MVIPEQVGNEQRQSALEVLDRVRFSRDPNPIPSRSDPDVDLVIPKRVDDNPHEQHSEVGNILLHMCTKKKARKMPCLF